MQSLLQKVEWLIIFKDHLVAYNIILFQEH